MSLSNPFDRLEESDISAEDMSVFLTYNPETGFLYWKERERDSYDLEVHWLRWNKFYAGQRAGTLTAQGYVALRIFGKTRKAHRIVWLLVNGVWPSNQNDHINGDKSDNRIENLRDVSGLENQRNRKTNKNAKSGFRGVYWNILLNKWRAHIKDNNKNIHLGYFEDFEKAVEARILAETKIGFHKNHGKIIELKRR